MTYYPRGEVAWRGDVSELICQCGAPLSDHGLNFPCSFFRSNQDKRFSSLSSLDAAVLAAAEALFASSQSEYSRAYDRLAEAVRKRRNEATKRV